MTAEPSIRISRFEAPEGGSWVKVAPEGFLGIPRYNGFKQICERAELIFNRKVQSNIGPLHRAARAIWLFRAADFQLVSETPELLTAYERDTLKVERYLDRTEALFARIDPILQEARGGAILPYQKQDVRRMIQEPVGINANPMGTGKSLESLLSIYPEDAPVLVICPANARGVWRDETETLQFWQRQIITLQGNNSWQWPRPGQMVILGSTCMPRLIPEGCWPDTNLFVDEIHFAKNPKAARSQRLRQVIDQVFDQLGRVWGLTGTPMDTGIDLWELARLLGLEDRAFGNVPGCSNAWEGFLKLFGGKRIQRYIPAMVCRDGRKIPPRKMPQWEFKASRVTPAGPVRLSRILIRHRKEDILPLLPAKRYQLVPVQLSELLRGKELREIRQQLDGIWDQVKHGTDQQIFERLSDGKPGFTEYSEIAKLLALAKIDFVHGMLDEMEELEEPVVVFCHHLEPVLQLGARPGWGMIHGGIEDRFEIAQQFQRGELKGLALTIGAGKESLTLTRAHEMIFIDRFWRFTDNAQAEDRCHRLGQKWPLRIRDVEADHPLERKRRQILLHKQAMANKTIDAMTGTLPKIITWDML